ncbi:MAG: hypothetical protein CVV18_03035 [Gammaproteobacteria bacterium HGW-Gammaproteobacteria-8]|nr:MAG: hypothetical protein CVV18_03035 [Gammaproteobacteria bacterium HGW-Gammaproteobacteria-8]
MCASYSIHPGRTHGQTLLPTACINYALQSICCQNHICIFPSAGRTDQPEAPLSACASSMPPSRGGIQAALNPVGTERYLSELTQYSGPTGHVILYNSIVLIRSRSMSTIDAELPPRAPRELHEIESEITELAAHIHAATYRLLELIREFDEREGWGGPELRSCAHWLNWKIGISLGAAREKVRVAHALKDLPKISDSFRQGQISFSKVRAMTRVATPENEEYLMMIARHGTASHMERLMRYFRKVKRIEALEVENQRHELREMNWYVDDDGSYVIKARLTPEQGERILKAVEAAMDEEFQERKDVSAETPEQPAINPASEPVAQRRADALARVAEGFLGSEAGNNGGERSTIHLHTDLDTLRQDGEGAECRLESGAHVSAETSRRLACDCGVVHWEEDEDGEPLNIGRKSRSIPPAIRRALKRRDHGCRFPGCTAHKYVDAHHIQHWADGGETRLDNLVLLCRHHHRLVHEGGYGIRMTDQHIPQFTDPAGRTIPPVGEKRFRGNVFTLRHENRKAGLDINPDTTIPLWEGEKMDYDMAIEAMLWMESPQNQHSGRRDEP